MDKLGIIINILVVLEMLVINLVQVHVFSKRKYSLFTTIFWLALLTVALIASAYILMSKSSNFGNGNGLFILLGSIYLIPIKILYEPPLRKKMIVLYTSWFYTGLAFTLGVQIGKLFPEKYFPYVILGFQTIYYIITITIYLKYFRIRYINTVNSINEKVSGRYLIISFLMYLSLISINYTFVTENKVMAFISFLILGVTSTFSFYFIFVLVSTTKSNQELTKLTYFDSITKVPNRNYLLKEFEKNKEQLPLTITFIDLDRFKNINDTYGHDTGDEYLRLFSKYVLEHFNGRVNLYRLYGDEFILLSHLSKEEVETELIYCQETIINKFQNIEFLGFSYGVISISDEKSQLEEVLKEADKLLYINKNSKR